MAIRIGKVMSLWTLNIEMAVSPSVLKLPTCNRYQWKAMARTHATSRSATGKVQVPKVRDLETAEVGSGKVMVKSRSISRLHRDTQGDEDGPPSAH